MVRECGGASRLWPTMSRMIMKQRVEHEVVCVGVAQMNVCVGWFGFGSRDGKRGLSRNSRVAHVASAITDLTESASIIVK